MAEEMKFTTERLAGLKPLATGERNIRDTESPLGVRLQANGAAHFVLRYRLPGAKNPKRVTLGAVGVLPLREARDMATAYVVAARQGRDPAEERKAAAAGDGPTLADAIGSYEATQRRNNIKNAVADAETLRREFKGLLPGALTKLKRADFVAVLKKLQRSRPGTAQKAQTLLHGVLALAVDDGVVDVNVMAGMRAKRGSRKQKNLAAAEKAGRALSLDEIALLWRACEDRRTPPAFGHYVKFILVTGVRRIEASMAERSWLKPATAVEPAFVRIPGRVTKNGKPIDVFLPPFIMAGLSAFLCTHNERWLFPGRASLATGETAPITGWSKRWPALLKVAADYGLDKEISLHDLRRTLRTGYEAMGVAPKVAEAQINHVSGDRLDVAYNLHDYRPERIAAANAWADAIENALKPTPPADDENVTPLRKSAKLYVRSA